jgi:GTPase
LSDFADYVHKKQAQRLPPGATAPTPVLEEHDELDILDQLGLAEESTSIRLKQVLLSKDDVNESIKQLTKYIHGRLDEGHGECLFDLGLEDNGDAMGFNKEDWEFALQRLEDAAKEEGAECSVLMTRNVGGAGDVGPNGKDTSSSGKLMIRRKPASVDDVIETRIAVVGNGKPKSQERQ